MNTQREAIDPNKYATARRALKALEALAHSRGFLSAAEGAGIRGVERSTAYRMLTTLMGLAKWCATSARLPPPDTSPSSAGRCSAAMKRPDW
jgi:IclR helix-turn-helix domain